MVSLRRSVGRLLPAPMKLRIAKKVAKIRYVAPLRVAKAPAAQPSPYPHWIASPNLLTELGEKYAPTKRYHNYLAYYWLHFRDVREQVRAFLEIGVQSDRSVKMWSEFFPNATIYGIDIDPRCKSYESDRVKIFIGSQADSAFLEDCLRQIGQPLDIVVDDGSHRPDHQMASFNALFPRLSSHGIYVVEDTGGVVEDQELRTVNRLKQLIDRVFYWPKDPDAHWTTLADFPADADWLARNVTGVAFYRWIVFVMRGNNPRDNPSLPLSAEIIARDQLAPLSFK